MSINDRFLTLRNRVKRITGQLYLTALLGDESGLIPGTIPGTVKIRQQSSNPDVLFPSIEVLAPAGKMLSWNPGDPVELEYDNKNRLRIKSPDADVQLSIGIDPVGVSLQQSSTRVAQVNIETLSVMPDSPPSLIVSVKAWNIVVNGVYYEFGGADINLETAGTGFTSLIPISGEQCYAVLFVESDYQTLSAVASTPIPIAELLGPLNIQECLDAIGLTVTPVFAIKLIGDQTEVSQDDLEVDGRDLRQMVNTAAAVNPNSSMFQIDRITTRLVIPENAQGNYREEVLIDAELVVDGRLYIG